jgi:hypothetical protein
MATNRRSDRQVRREGTGRHLPNHAYEKWSLDNQDAFRHASKGRGVAKRSKANRRANSLQHTSSSPSPLVPSFRNPKPFPAFTKVDCRMSTKDIIAETITVIFQACLVVVLFIALFVSIFL